MSFNLCADAYLMAFADKAQVIALTPQARDASLSAFAEQAAGWPVSSGRTEEVLALKPDLVIVSSYSDPMRNRIITETGIRLVTLDAADTYAAARQDIIKLGRAIGREAAARAYLETLDAALAALTPRPDAPRLLPLQRRNLTAGRGHIVDDIIRLAGGRNLGAALSDGVMGRISLETVLAAEADYLLVNEQTGRPDSRGAEFLTHPALAERFAGRRRLTLDNALTVCAGATTPRAVASLLAQLAD